MLSLVTAAEHQYRFESQQLDRDIALRRSIREHQAQRIALEVAPVPDAARTRRETTWARPIGAHLQPATACAAC